MVIIKQLPLKRDITNRIMDAKMSYMNPCHGEKTHRFEPYVRHLCM